MYLGRKRTKDGQQIYGLYIIFGIRFLDKILKTLYLFPKVPINIIRKKPWDRIVIKGTNMSMIYIVCVYSKIVSVNWCVSLLGGKQVKHVFRYALCSLNVCVWDCASSFTVMEKCTWGHFSQNIEFPDKTQASLKKKKSLSWWQQKKSTRLFCCVFFPGVTHRTMFEKHPSRENK